MGIQMVQCPNNGKCGSKSHIYSSQAFQDCQKANTQSVGFSQPQTPFIDVIPGMNEDAAALAECAFAKLLADIKHGNRPYYDLSGYHRALGRSEIEDVLAGRYADVRESYQEGSEYAGAVNEIAEVHMWRDLCRYQPELSEIGDVAPVSEMPELREFLHEAVWEVMHDQYFDACLKNTYIDEHLTVSLHGDSSPVRVMQEFEKLFRDGHSSLFSRHGDIRETEITYNAIIQDILDDNDAVVDLFSVGWDYNGDLFSVSPVPWKDTQFAIHEPVLIIDASNNQTHVLPLRGITINMTFPQHGPSHGDEPSGISIVER